MLELFEIVAMLRMESIQFKTERTFKSKYEIPASNTAHPRSAF